MRRLGWIETALLLPLLAGCAGAPTGTAPAPIVASATVPPITPAPTSTAEPIHVDGAKNGDSGKVKLAAGTYDVHWDASDGTDTGCSFVLLLTTKHGGPIVAKITASIFPDGTGHAETARMTVKKAGTYVLEEDQSGLVSCRRPWSADLTPTAP